MVTTTLSESLPLTLAERIGKRYELPPFLPNSFTDISHLITQVKVFPKFIYNRDLMEQIDGWPGKIITQPFCRFSIPYTSNNSDTGDETHTLYSDSRIEVGMGRGITQAYAFVRKNETRAKRLSPGDLGIYDPNTGFFYTSIGSKGNGPTAIEMLRVKGEMPEAEKRQNGAWGILWETLAEKKEQKRLDILAKIGFRVGQVPVIFNLDRDKLERYVGAIYQASGYDHIYNIKTELSGGSAEDHPCIMTRLACGVRADTLMYPKTDPLVLFDGIYGFASEISRRGMENFMTFYRIPPSLKGDIEELSRGNFSWPPTKETAKAYLKTISFTMWRNYYLQDEVNEKYKNNELFARMLDISNFPNHNKVGPIWLNYKPGDWDVGGFMFDVDIIGGKGEDAARIGVNVMRNADSESLGYGLNFIGSKLGAVCGIDWMIALRTGKIEAQGVHNKNGFLANNLESIFPEFFSQEKGRN